MSNSIDSLYFPLSFAFIDLFIYLFFPPSFGSVHVLAVEREYVSTEKVPISQRPFSPAEADKTLQTRGGKERQRGRLYHHRRSPCPPRRATCRRTFYGRFADTRRLSRMSRDFLLTHLLFHMSCLSNFIDVKCGHCRHSFLSRTSFKFFATIVRGCVDRNQFRLVRRKRKPR